MSQIWDYVVKETKQMPWSWDLQWIFSDQVSKLYPENLSRHSRHHLFTKTPTIWQINLNQTNIREKENLENETIAELEQKIGNLFKKALLEFKSKSDKLVSSPCTNSRICIDKLEGQIKQKDQVINHLLVSLKT